MRNSAPIRFLFRCVALILLALVAPLVIRMSAPGVDLPACDTAARSMISGNQVRLDIDQVRYVKVAYARQAPERKRVLVLGGSRAATIAASWFPAGDFWNAAVPNGGINDAAAFFEAFLETNRVPDTLILEVFPALIRPLETPDRHATDPYLARALERYRIATPPRFSREPFWTDFIPRLHTSWLKLARAASGKPDLNSRLEPDGRIHFSTFSETANPTAEEVSGSLQSMSAAEVQWRSKSQPDEFAAVLFRRFLSDLQSRGVHVILFLAPLHPLAWEFFRRRGGYDDTWIRRELASRGIPIVGTYSPSAANASPADFYDGIHPRPALVRRLLVEGGVISDTRREPPVTAIQ